mmetsp:Transcript_13805/g.33994  ORF Transcript_13805/g.33994 Transcript_13805/m.33994 type:complete len:231 (-) Transcript_13805:752-1444(-)
MKSMGGFCFWFRPAGAGCIPFGFAAVVPPRLLLAMCSSNAETDTPELFNSYIPLTALLSAVPCFFGQYEDVDAEAPPACSCCSRPRVCFCPRAAGADALLKIDCSSVRMCRSISSSCSWSGPMISSLKSARCISSPDPGRQPFSSSAPSSGSASESSVGRMPASTCPRVTASTALRLSVSSCGTRYKIFRKALFLLVVGVVQVMMGLRDRSSDFSKASVANLPVSTNEET